MPVTRVISAYEMYAGIVSGQHWSADRHFLQVIAEADAVALRTAVAGEGELAGFTRCDCAIGPTGTDSLSIALQCARRDDALPQKQKEMRRHVAKQWRYQHRCGVGFSLSPA